MKHMDNKKKTLILIVIFVVLMIGASVLYNSLSKNYAPDNMTIENNDNAADNTSTSTDNNGTSETAANSKENPDSESTSESEETAPSPAPDFTVYDIDGNEVHLSDSFGKPIIVNFWASWCGPCKMEMPDFDEAYNTYKDDIVFLMVNMTDGSRETVEVASEFIADSGYTFPVYYDTQYSAAVTYSVSSLPTTYFLNEKGELVAHARGAIDAATLQRGIDMIYESKQ